MISVTEDIDMAQEHYKNVQEEGDNNNVNETRINKRMVNKIWCYFLSRRKVMITQKLKIVKTSLKEHSGK